MADFALNHGQRFNVEGVDFEVVSISQNEHTGETVYEVVSAEDAQKRRDRNVPEAPREEQPELPLSTAEVEAAAETATPAEDAAPAAASEVPETLQPKS